MPRSMMELDLAMTSNRVGRPLSALYVITTAGINTVTGAMMVAEMV